MKRVALFISFFSLAAQITFGQQNYDDFDGHKFQYFGMKNGILDSSVVNSDPNTVNNSARYAKYKRSTSKYDNLKIFPIRKLTDVSTYATYLGNPPKFTMKVYTSAPIGTKIEIQLGKKGDDNYPSGVHSQYEGFTKTKNAWEEVVFTFSQIPKGSTVDANSIDKITVLFAPNTSSSEVFYFDDLIGPGLTSSQAEAAPSKK